MTEIRKCGTCNDSITQQYIYFASTFEEAWHSRLRIGRFYVVIIVGLISAFAIFVSNALKSETIKIDLIWASRGLGIIVALLGGAWRLSLKYWSQAQDGRLTVIKNMESTYKHLFCLYHSEDAQYDDDNCPYEGLVRIERWLAWIAVAAGSSLLFFAHNYAQVFLR